MGDTCGKRRLLKRRQLASTGSTRMTIHGHPSEYLPKRQADLEEKQESCNPPKGSDQALPPPQRNSGCKDSAAAKKLPHHLLQLIYIAFVFFFPDII